MAELNLHQKYTRKEVHDYFVPGGTFTPNSGTWGLHGCVRVPGASHDFVFFVTYGQSQGDHFFQEGISKNGVITWQSQPRQHLNESRVLRWIEQHQLLVSVKPMLSLRKLLFGQKKRQLE